MLIYYLTKTSPHKRLPRTISITIKLTDRLPPLLIVGKYGLIGNGNFNLRIFLLWFYYSAPCTQVAKWRCT